VDLIGDVAAAGRTTEEIARELEQRIADYRQEPLATVSVTAANSATITILGEVGEPGQYSIARETRLADAIALAGGATQLAAASRVRLIRWDTDRTVVYEANLDEIQGGDGATNAMLADGDTVFVPPATPVSFGYAIRRVLYPVEVVLGTVAGILVGLIAS
jgi:polysaccharide export outer membrane protein